MGKGLNKALKDYTNKACVSFGFGRYILDCRLNIMNATEMMWPQLVDSGLPGGKRSTCCCTIRIWCASFFFGSLPHFIDPPLSGHILEILGKKHNIVFEVKMESTLVSLV